MSIKTPNREHTERDNQDPRAAEQTGGHQEPVIIEQKGGQQDPGAADQSSAGQVPNTTAREKPATKDTPNTPAVRVEVIANRSVQEDFFERLRKRDIGTHYTLFPEVQGAGDAGPRRGDHIWPEENFVYVAYVSAEDARGIKEEVEALKAFFQDEGIRFFAVSAMAI